MKTQLLSPGSWKDGQVVLMPALKSKPCSFPGRMPEHPGRAQGMTLS